MEVLISEFGLKSSKVPANSLIASDFGIVGDDAVDLLKFVEAKIGKRINIDFDRYFQGEPGFLIFENDKADITIKTLAKLISEQNTS